MTRAPGHYSRLSQAETDGFNIDAPAQDGAPGTRPNTAPSRPPVYYGDGPFEAPSSEDEDEEEKALNSEYKESTSMRVLHTLGYHDEDMLTDDLERPIASGLIVGQRVRSSRAYIGFQFLKLYAEKHATAGSARRAAGAVFAGCNDRVPCRVFVPRRFLQGARAWAHHYGPCFQRHL